MTDVGAPLPQGHVDDTHAGSVRLGLELDRRHRALQFLRYLLQVAGWPWLFAVLAMTVVMSVIGLLLTHALHGSALVDLDMRIARDLAANRTPRLDSLANRGTGLAEPTPIAALWFGAVVVAGVTTRRWVAPMFVMFAVGGEKLSYLLTTIVVDRPRPPVPPVGVVHVTSSFPSGHVGSAVSLYGSIAVLVFALALPHRSRAWHVAAGCVVALIAVVVAISRVYSGQHFLTDVICGAVIGTTWLYLGYRLSLGAHDPWPASRSEVTSRATPSRSGTPSDPSAPHRAASGS
jgi:undecaprenyl-diphosphatase